MRQLESIGSESAALINRLELTRPIIEEPMRLLRHSHAAQVNLANVLCGTRFKHSFSGVLVPTECQNRSGGRTLACGREDSFEHMMACYRLQDERATGAEAIPVLIKLATRTMPIVPGVNLPKYIL